MRDSADRRIDRLAHDRVDAVGEGRDVGGEPYGSDARQADRMARHDQRALNDYEGAQACAEQRQRERRVFAQRPTIEAKPEPVRAGCRTHERAGCAPGDRADDHPPVAGATRDERERDRHRGDGIDRRQQALARVLHAPIRNPGR